MSDLASRLLLFNFGASMVAGLWAVAVVYGVTRVTGVVSAEARTNLLLLPFLKSTLVVLGISTVMPFPGDFWRGIRSQALGLTEVGPLLLLAAGASLIAFDLFRRRAFRSLRTTSHPAPPDSRTVRALEHLADSFNTRHDALNDCSACCMPAQMPRPEIYLSDKRSSPGLLAGDPPVLFLPRSLETELDEEELEGVIAHELAHLWLRRPCGVFDSHRMQSIGLANPTSLLLGRLLAREEERACDEIASEITGNPEALASALVKTYKSLHNGQHRVPVLVAGLFGRHPHLEDRLERLLGSPQSLAHAPRLRWYVTTVVVIALIFIG